MTTKYVPKKSSSGDTLWKWLQTPVYDYVGGTGWARTKDLFLAPTGYHTGAFSKNFKMDEGGILTNPYGITSSVSELFSSPMLYLSPGQSVDIRSGRLSDPNLHAGTAQRLNNQIQERRVNEAGLSQASEDSARKSPSVLATLDDLYFANVATSVKTSFELSQLSQAKQEGFNSSGTKTILGASKPPVPVSKKLEIH